MKIDLYPTLLSSRSTVSIFGSQIYIYEAHRTFLRHIWHLYRAKTDENGLPTYIVRFYFFYIFMKIFFFVLFEREPTNNAFNPAPTELSVSTTAHNKTRLLFYYSTKTWNVSGCIIIHLCVYYKCINTTSQYILQYKCVI